MRPYLLGLINPYANQRFAPFHPEAIKSLCGPSRRQDALIESKNIHLYKISDNLAYSDHCR